jgi:glycerol-3-phosphate acyltransferase PlsX
LKVIDGLEHPRVGLLNLGREPIKGTKVVQRAFALLKRSSLNFAGNIEPHELFQGHTDAVICDGFVGNIVLKMYEGLSEAFIHLLETYMDEKESDFKQKLRETFRRFQEVLHYQNVGGAPLLGVRRTVVVAHGRSQRLAIARAIQLAYQMAKDQVCERMAEELDKDSILPELRHQNARLMLDSLRNKWGFAHKSG